MAGEMPLEPKDFDGLNSETVFYDIVYNPTNTVLLKEASHRGFRTIEGLDMLIYQAQRAIEIWTGKVPDTNLMKIAALKALGWFTCASLIFNIQFKDKLKRAEWINYK